MADIDIDIQYVLTNALIGPTKVIASTTENASVIVEPADSTDNQLWYLTETNTTERYRLHTVQKGNFWALDIFNYYGHSSMDLQFFSVDDAKNGQFWRVDTWDDGSIKLSNDFTGSYITLNVLENMEVTLTGDDTPGQHWTFNRSGSIQPQSGATTTGTATTISTTRLYTCPPTTADCSPSAIHSSIPSKKLSGREIAGIAIGSFVALVALAAFLLRKCWRRRSYSGAQIEAVRENGMWRAG